MTNRRNFQRIQFATTSRLSVGDKVITGELLDISLRGALLGLKDQPSLQPGKLYGLEINLSSSDINLDFQVEMVHCTGNEYGFKFVEQDIETISHLRRLLELNIGDNAEIDREISFLTQE